MTFIKKNYYLLIACALFIGFSFVIMKKLEHEVNYEEVVVAEGDTLWAYSTEYAKNLSTELWIDEVVKVNNLTSTTIKVGEKLTIPVLSTEIEYNHIATNSVEELE